MPRVQYTVTRSTNGTPGAAAAVPIQPGRGSTVITPTVRTRRHPIQISVSVVTPVELFSPRLASGYIVPRPIANSPVETTMSELLGHGIETAAVREGTMRPPEPEFAG